MRPLPIREEVVADAVRDMISREVLPRQERPTFVRLDTTNVTPVLSDTYCQSTASPLPNSKGVISPKRCPGESLKLNCSDIKADAEQTTGKLTARLTADGLSLVSYRAWQKAAQEAISFIDRLLLALSPKA